jgi:hypothetical protein
MAGGRPTKYQPEFCDLIIGVGEEGGWLSEMAEACDVHRNTMDVWADEHPEFLEALTRAKQKAQVWFEKKGREGLTADKFNSALWSKQMSARHPGEYTERKEFTGKDGGPIATDNTHHGEIAISDTAAFIADAIGSGTNPTPGEPGED